MSALIDAAEDPVVTWNAVLDAYEARILAVRDAAAAGDPTAVPLFIPPVNIGPMPDEVVGRAKALLVASREVERLLLQAKTAIHARLTAPRENRAPRRASRLDISV